ncbi:MAG: CNNM domain-containing protein [Planctomycetota bacterium]
MIWFALGLGVVGLFLSAFFSGSEMGFYRATRLRLVLDALGGDFVARGLVWLTNHPSMFVATTLVGNNLANYLTSLAIVMGVQAILFANGRVQEHGHLMELIAPLLWAPLLFVYGELLPKNLFLNAPNRLLRKGGPLFLFFVLLFLPVSVLLWGLNWVFARLLAEPPEPVRIRLARRELQRVLEEGHEAGLLHPSQVKLAQGIFAVATHPVTRYLSPSSEVPRARKDMGREEVCRLARRHEIPDVPVEDTGADPRLVGYVRVIDLGLVPSESLGPIRPLMEIPHTDSHVDALMRMQSAQESLAQVVDAEGQTLGILTARRLREPLFRGGR